MSQHTLGEADMDEKSKGEVTTESKLSRKPYAKPAFRFEQVFETRALICSKVSSTQAQCHSSQKTS